MSLDSFVKTLIPAWDKQHYPMADRVEQHIPIYAGNALSSLNAQGTVQLQQEWVKAWRDGAGVICIQGLYDNPDVVHAMTQVIMTLFEKQNQQDQTGGDHFAQQGMNGRLWNSLGKAGMANAKVFIDYYKNPLLAQVCHAWLGPGYRMTAQANLVYPGGQAQAAHRDYHLGFYTQAQLAQVPMHVQRMSSMLTLQGAIAHIDMPVESGTTLFLPYSQRYDQGYSLYHQADLQTYFFAHAVQLPLSVGDGVFFNPAIIHAAGENTTCHVKRLANLLQVVSGFSVPMESLDLVKLPLQCFDTLKNTRLTSDEQDALLTVISASNPFPANMDRDAPGKSLMPVSGRDLLQQALTENWHQDQLVEAFTQLQWRKQSH